MWPRGLALALSIAAAISGCGVASVVAPSQQARDTPAQLASSNRSRAERAAEAMLNEVAAPDGAHRVSTVRSLERFARGMQAFWIASQADRYAFWRTSSSPDAVLGRIEAGLPKSAKLGMHGDQIGSAAWATYAFPTIDRRYLGARALLLVALGQPGGGSTVLAEGEVRYIAPRPDNQRIPQQSRILDVTVGSNLSRPLVSRTVTDAWQVRRIAQIVDALPFVGNESGTAFSCPAYSSTFPVDRFIFRATPHGPVLAKVSELAATPTYDDPCGGTSLTIRGRREPVLQDGGILLRQAAALLDARLICTTKFIRTNGGVKPEVRCQTS